MLSIIASVAGLIVPPAFDFIKKKFLKPAADSPEATISTLATTKPEVLGEFVNANVALLKAKKDFFNRDIIGIPSKWVVDLRAAIRPTFILLSLAVRAAGWMYNWNIDESFTALMDLSIASWFGSRLI